MCRAGRFWYRHLPNLYYTHYSQPPKGCWTVHLAGTIILEKMSIHIHPNNMGKVERGCFCPYFSLLEKKGGSYLAVWGWREQAAFVSATIYPAKDWTVMMTTLWWGLCPRDQLLEDSSAKLIRCYQSTQCHQWHERVSADHRALRTDGSWSVCIKVMVHTALPSASGCMPYPKCLCYRVLPVSLCKARCGEIGRGKKALSSEVLFYNVLTFIKFITSKIIKKKLRTSLAVQGLKLCSFTAGGTS